MLIISSAAFVPAELVAELGELPPAFMPLRNRRVYQHQLDALAALDERVVLSLPNSFEIEAFDAQSLRDRDCQVATTDDGLSLVRSLRALLEQNRPAKGEPLRVLHGDTVQLDLPLDRFDVVSVGRNEGHYARAFAVADENGALVRASYRYCQPGDPVLTGYFSFCDVDRFIELLSEHDDFIEVINAYREGCSSPIPVHTAKRWYDCGHVNAYYLSRALNTTERAFNDMRMTHRYIRKSGGKAGKLDAERQWFETLPAPMRHYAPQLGVHGAETGEPYYDIEYICALPLSDLLVFGQLSKGDWSGVLSLCGEFLADCSAHVQPNDEAALLEPGAWRELYLPKTQSRLQEFCEASGWRSDQPTVINGVAMPPLDAVAAAAQAVLDAAPARDRALIHGDFCFSNILYDSRARRIKVIDPRGHARDGSVTMYGDPLYDQAKLFHSVVGGYDFVVAGHIRGELVGVNEMRLWGRLPERASPVAEAYRKIAFGDGASISERVVAAATVHLFLSMLPLHDDAPERQLAFVARGLDLYERYDLGAGA